MTRICFATAMIAIIGWVACKKLPSINDEKHCWSCPAIKKINYLTPDANTQDSLRQYLRDSVIKICDLSINDFNQNSKWFGLIDTEKVYAVSGVYSCQIFMRTKVDSCTIVN